MADALQVDGLVHAYGATPVLGGVDLTVRPGELVAVLGASGCGKTTMLRSIAGLVVPTGGRIHIGGREVVANGRERVPIERRRVGLVFQDYALFGAMTVAQNVAYGIGRDDARVAELLDRVGLAGLGDRRPSQLSGGQQQRVALARAMAPRPDLLLLDEPFANVDAERRAELGASLRRALAAEGRAALLVTHDRTDALSLADRVLVLVPGARGGVAGQLGTPEEVYGAPVDLQVARLTGPCAVFDGAVVRPEDLAVVPAGQPGTVVASQYLGDHVRLTVETDGGVVLVRHPTRLARGTAVCIGRAGA
jgi:iron(III) transport system ATP-binding protein